MCILRGCSVSCHGHQQSDDTQKAYMWCALSFDSAGCSYDVFRSEQCLQHSSRVQPCSVNELVISFEWNEIVDLWEAGSMYQRITTHIENNILVVCHCFKQSSMEHYHTSRLDSGWLHSTDALYKQWWPSKQHPGKKFRHILHLLCHKGPL